MQATLALRFGGEGILKVKGIPFKAGGADVRKFFSGYKIKPRGVNFIMHADGRPTGMAFVEFETPQEAVRAMVRAREGDICRCRLAERECGCRSQETGKERGSWCHQPPPGANTILFLQQAHRWCATLLVEGTFQAIALAFSYADTHMLAGCVAGYVWHDLKHFKAGLHCAGAVHTPVCCSWTDRHCNV